MKRDVWILAEALDNIGDFALLTQAIHVLRSNPRIGAIAVRQWVPAEAQAVSELAQLEVGLVAGKSPRALWPGRRLLLYAGGQAVRDNASPASMWALWVMMQASRWAGGRRAAMAIGASDLVRPFHRLAWRRLLASFAFISSRDELSLRRLRDLYPGPHLHLTDDLAFLPSPLHERLAQPAPVRHVLVAPCHDPTENRLLDPAAVARIVRAVRDECPAPALEMLCHDPRPGMDVAIASRIAGELDDIGTSALRIVSAGTLDVAIAAYRECAAVVTNRLHALIFGILAGKPVFVIDDGNSKVEAFARRFGVPVIAQAGLSDRTLERQIAAGLDAVGRHRSEELARAKAAAARNVELLNNSF